MAMVKRLLQVLLGLSLALVLIVAGVVLFMPGLHSSSLAMMLNVMIGAGGDTPEDQLLAQLQAAEGYQVSVFARGLAHPRMLHRTTGGRLLVSNPRSGEVLQFTDTDGDGAADDYQVLLSGLRRPHGLDIQGEHLYIAESHQVGRISYDQASGETRGDYAVVVSDFTDEGNHWSKSIRFDSAGNLYVAMGSTCNVCEEKDSRRATIMRYSTDGFHGEVFASGLRNSVGLAFAPWDGALYATDNGRDLLGDEYPPCELNRIVQGGFYGWPYLNGDNDLDPDFGVGKEALQSTAIVPSFNFRAHNAPLGIYFPDSPEKTALVALHGSWNRSTPDGYKVVKLLWEGDGGISVEDFLWGFENDGEIIGRPVDIVGDGKGGFLISDDYARVIYRVRRAGVATAAAGLDISAAAGLDNNAAEKHRQAQNFDPVLVSGGQRLFQSMSCGECHDPDALTPVPLAGLAESYDTESLTGYFLTPTPPMPRYELSLEQRQQLAHYLLNRERDQSPAGM